MKSKFFSGIILYAMIAFLMAACSASSSTLVPSPEATITPASTPTNSLPSPTENTPLVPATNTPVSAPPISPSNFQNITSLYQWNVASDIVKITGAALSPLADKVALLTVRYPEQYSLELREAETGNLIWKQPLDAKADYSAMAFSADRSLIAIGTGSGNVTVWNISDGSLSQTLKGAAYAVRAVAFSPDGDLIAAAGSDSMVHVWQVSDGVPRTPYVLKKNVGKLVFSPDSKYLATSSDVFAVYDLTSANNAPVVYYDASAPHPTAEILFSPDSHYLIAEGELDDANHNTWIPRILIWNLSSNRNTFRKIPIPDVIQNMIVLPDGQSILGYDASKGQLDAIDISNKATAGTVDLGTLLFMDYSANLSRFVVVTQSSVAIWGVSR
jgi:WD40 repeat protein